MVILVSPVMVMEFKLTSIEFLSFQHGPLHKYYDSHVTISVLVLYIS